MEIVFFGTGPVAAASLESLATNFSIELVITKQAPAHHKGSVPVLEVTNRLGLAVEFANTKEELDQLMEDMIFESKVGVIVDYGVIVSKRVIDIFALGIINSHFSLLPEWRGADPITFTILSGQTETGVSLMKIVEALDEGQLIAQEKIEITPNATTPSLTGMLIKKNNEMFKKFLDEYASGNIVPYDQPDIPATYSRKLTKDDGILDWTKPAVQLEREIRGYIDWPKSRCVLAGKDVVITKARSEQRAVSSEQGVEIGDAKVTPEKQLEIQTGDGVLIIEKLKPAGKPEMSVEAFLAGYGHLLSK
ncbi:MAG: methionyl-tRNA formyltransferase [Patescibacteria group bacterium]